MKRVTDDLLQSTLDRWYSYLSSWQEPGISSRAQCEICSDSPYLTIAGLHEWPHDIAHILIRDLSSAVRHISFSLEELGAVDLDATSDPNGISRVLRRHEFDRRAERLVMGALHRQQEEMRDVLQQCVAPAFETWLMRESDRAVEQIRGFEGSGMTGLHGETV